MSENLKKTYRKLTEGQRRYLAANGLDPDEIEIVGNTPNPLLDELEYIEKPEGTVHHYPNLPAPTWRRFSLTDGVDTDSLRYNLLPETE